MKRWIKRVLSGYLMMLGIISVFAVQFNAEDRDISCASNTMGMIYYIRGRSAKL